MSPLAGSSPVEPLTMEPAPPTTDAGGAPRPPKADPAPPHDARAPGLYRLSVEQYDRMLASGILTPDDKVELLEGLLVLKMSRYPPHILVTKRLYALLGRLLSEGWHVAKEDPVGLVASVPEPDLAVLRGTFEDYAARIPSAGDVAWVAEVSDTTYGSDRAEIRLYAEAGIPTCWIVNIPSRRVEVYTDPTGPDSSPDYRQRRDFCGGERIPLAIAGQQIELPPADDLLPPS